MYYGTLAVIGLAVPGGYYSPFFAKYLNYIAGLRYFLLHGSRIFLSLLGYKTIVDGVYTLRFVGGNGVHVVYSCIGYGVLSFWGAFVLANRGKVVEKMKWLLGGWLIIYFINVIRISLFLISINKKWPLPFHMNHHTLFAIAAYTAILILIFFYDKSHKTKQDTVQSDTIIDVEKR